MKGLFYMALGREVEAELIKTIKSGAERCEVKVFFEHNRTDMPT